MCHKNNRFVSVDGLYVCHEPLSNLNTQPTAPAATAPVAVPPPTEILAQPTAPTPM